jgi:hypothetical protein
MVISYLACFFLLVFSFSGAYIYVCVNFFFFAPFLTGLKVE